MTARPADAAWQPLGWYTDPVPGDPGRIDTEAQHLSKIAGQIADQVGMLKAIAAQGTEVGKHAEKIRTSAGTLAGKLDTVGTRYKKVSSALSAWSPQLSQAQSMSLQALNQAEAPYKQLTTPAAPPSGHLTASQQQQAVTDYNNAMSKAQGQLEAALALLGRATSLRDSEGSHCASVINNACDDALKDSFWERFKDFVDKWSWLIKDVCTALEVLATVAAVLALLLTGVGWLVIAGVVMTGLAMVGRAALAAAGDGSWLDVGMDAFALLTFGLGEELTGTLGKTVDAMTETGKGIQLAKAAPLLDRFSEVAGQDAVGRVAAKFVKETVPEVSEDAATTLGERLADGAGEAEVVNKMKTVSLLEAKFSDSPEMAGLAAAARTSQNLLRVNFAVSNAVSLGGLAGGGIEIDGPGDKEASLKIPAVGRWYSRAQDDLTTHGGLTSGQAGIAADVIADAADPGRAAVQGFRLALSSF